MKKNFFFNQTIQKKIVLLPNFKLKNHITMKKIFFAACIAALMMGCAKEFEAEPQKTEADKLKEEFDKAYLEWVKQGAPIGTKRKNLAEFGNNDGTKL